MVGKRSSKFSRHGVQPEVVDVLLDHRGGHGPRDLVPGQQLVDEPVAAVPEQRAVTPEGLGEQGPRHLGVVEGGGVELDELDVGQHGPGPQGHGDAVAGGLGRVGGHREHLAGPARGQQGVAGLGS